MLEIKNLSVSVENKIILDGVSLDIELGKNYCILGKNGSGKSSFALTVMWHPSYDVSWGDIVLDGKSLLELAPDERSKLWVFLAFQNIPEIKWVKVFEFLRSIYSQKVGSSVSFLQFKKFVVSVLDELEIDKEFLWRDLNVGFSGWERRKLEVLQIKLLDPKYILLDEVDSGLDVDAFRSVANLLKAVDNENNCFVIITHLFTILEYISVNKVWVLEKWKLVKKGWEDLAMRIRKDGFAGE